MQDNGDEAANNILVKEMTAIVLVVVGIHHGDGDVWSVMVIIVIMILRIAKVEVMILIIIKMIMMTRGQWL